MIFIVAVELRKENQVKKNKHGSNISNEQKGKHYTTKENGQNVLNLKCN